MTDVSYIACCIEYTYVGSSFDHPVAGELSCNPGHLKLAVYLRFKKASEVCSLHCEISDLIFPYEHLQENGH